VVILEALLVAETQGLAQVDRKVVAAAAVLALHHFTLGLVAVVVEKALGLLSAEPS
jgi:hypothetical protein